MPHAHGHVLAEYHAARPEHVQQAIAASNAARRDWAAWPWEDRVAVLLRAAEFLATSWRATLNAATMLGQSKTVFQAEIDGACEMIDFWRFNCYFAQELYHEQPFSGPGVWNSMEYRGLEGFIYAVSPFNFTAIGGNLTTAPALMGNTVIWKPSHAAMLSSYYTYKVLEAAGLPPGVINFLPGDAVMITDALLDSPDFGGIHFTGSTAVFNSMWRTVGENMGRYRAYPRLVGETGGKDFIVAHPSADPQEVAVAIARGGFEYQGQKCSAASRAYIPQSLWHDVRDRTIAIMRDFKQGDPRDFRNFVSAVIDKKAFTKISGYLDDAKKNAKILQGGGAKGDEGYYIEPTLIQTEDPGYRLLCEEIFGPVVTTYVYPGQPVGRDARRRGQDVAVRADRVDLRARSRRHPRGDVGAAERRGQLLHQRQADRRGRGTAAVRRRARLGHERQGGLEAEPGALGERADREGNARAGAATTGTRSWRRSSARRGARRARCSVPRRCARCRVLGAWCGVLGAGARCGCSVRVLQSRCCARCSGL